MQDNFPARRDLLFAATAIATLGPFARFTVAFAQAQSGDLGITASQKMLLSDVLFADPVSYLAYAEVARLKVRGDAATQKFDEAAARIKSFSPRDKLTAVGDAIRDRIMIDCVLLPGQMPEVTLQNLLAPAAVQIGISGALSREAERTLGQVAATRATVTGLMQEVQSVVLLPSMPDRLAQQYVAEGLRLLAADSGIQGLLGASMATLRKAEAAASQIQTAYASAAAGLSGLAKSFDDLAHMTPSPGSDPEKFAGDLSAAMTALGNAVHMNPATVHKINAGISVAGSALSGALAGSALGPIGTVAGGAMGLLGGLFGGGGGSNPALAQLSVQLDQLTQLINAGFAEMQQDFSALSDQMRDGFNALSQQMREFQHEIDTNLNALRVQLTQLARTQLQNSLDLLGDQATEHERQYLEFRVADGPSPDQSAAQLRLATTALLDTIKTDDVGFCSTTFVGDTLEQYLDKFGATLAKAPLAARLPLIANFNGGLRPSFFQPQSPGQLPQLIAPVTIAAEADLLAQRLREPRYGVADDHNGAAIIKGLHQQCYNAMVGIAASPEGIFIARDPVMSFLAPSSDAAAVAPPAVAPQDLWSIMMTMQQAGEALSDIDAAQDLLQTSSDFLAGYIRAHSLLTGQNSLPALLYARRRIAAQLADASAVVFCNPFMAAIDVYRRAVCTRLSSPLVYRPNHSTRKISDSATARAAMATYVRATMPLANVSSVAFTGDYSVHTAAVLQEVDKLFTTPSPAAPLLIEACKAAITALTPHLPAAVQTSGNKPLSAYLSDIRVLSLTLGVIERAVAARLGGLAAANATQDFSPWFDGFAEYGMAASYSLAQPLANIPGIDPEHTRAEVLMSALLEPALAGEVILNPPAGLAEGGRPYPNNIGHFWGWGAEDCRPGVAPPEALMQALLRPDCAFAGENGAEMGAAECFSQMLATLQQFATRTALTTKVKSQFPAGGASELLRAALHG
jgi:hypothetical protein